MTDPRELLPAARTDPTARLVLADRLRDDDGDSPAVAAVVGMTCETCGCPESAGRMMCRDRYGKWHDWEQTHHLNSDVGFALFDMSLETPGSWSNPTEGTLSIARSDRWHLLCPRCVSSFRAWKANRTRAANRQAAEDAAPNLFTGVE